MHPKAKVFMYPDPLDAEDKGLISQEVAYKSLKRVRELSKAGWRAVHSDFKRCGGQWMASAEDTAFCNEAAMLCTQDAHPPSAR